MSGNDRRRPFSGNFAATIGFPFSLSVAIQGSNVFVTHVPQHQERREKVVQPDPKIAVEHSKDSLNHQHLTTKTTFELTIKTAIEK